MNLGLLDLPAPLWDAIDGGLEGVGLPALARVSLYAMASGWVSMAIYRRLSRQAELQTLAAESRALRAELAGYDGEFDGLMQRVRRLLRLSARHLGLSFWPALVGGLPLVVLLPWLSNAFSTIQPTPGTRIDVIPEQLEVPIEALSWHPRPIAWDPGLAGWRIAWPEAGDAQRLMLGERLILELPTPAPSPVVHRRLPLLNLVVANPAGYLPDSAPLAALRLGLPPRQLHHSGPDWLRGWPAVYFGVLVLVSLLIRWRWRLH